MEDMDDEMNDDDAPDELMLFKMVEGDCKNIRESDKEYRVIDYIRISAEQHDAIWKAHLPKDGEERPTYVDITNCFKYVARYYRYHTLIHLCECRTTYPDLRIATIMAAGVLRPKEEKIRNLKTEKFDPVPVSERIEDYFRMASILITHEEARELKRDEDYRFWTLPDPNPSTGKRIVFCYDASLHGETVGCAMSMAHCCMRDLGMPTLDDLFYIQ